MIEKRMYVCDKCKSSFDTRVKCEEHEENCWKRFSKARSFVCSFDMKSLKFEHKLNTYNKAIILGDKVKVHEDTEFYHSLHKLIDYCKEDVIQYAFYTDKFFSDEEAKVVFNKLHEFILIEVEKRFDKIKEVINSKEFLEFYSNRYGKLRELENIDFNF